MMTDSATPRTRYSGKRGVNVRIVVFGLCIVVVYRYKNSIPLKEDSAMCFIENRMVIDSEWEFLEKKESDDDLISGYWNGKTKTFIPATDAYEYALDQVLGNGTDEDIRDFKEMLVEWFYSGGDWVKDRRQK